MEEKKKKKVKVWKVILFSLLGIVSMCVLVVGSYALYVVLDYYRIEDNQVLEVEDGATKSNVETNKELKLTTFNVGFGAYSDEYSFFMDKGYLEDGTPVSGKYGKGISYEDVLANTNGCIDKALSLDSDFYFFQEVDTSSDRSYFINQKEMIKEKFNDFDSTFAFNFHSSYLFYPLHDPHGTSNAGLYTLSSYDVTSSLRKRHVIDDGFDKYFDLDRCFSVNRVTTDNGKELVLINEHMSAYTSDGKIRNEQSKELSAFMLNEVEKGNYVICGGDFNQDLLTNNPLFPEFKGDDYAYKTMSKQRRPEWCSCMYDEEGKSYIDSSFKVYGATNEPSCRSCDIPWERGYNYVAPLDGFIVSDNIEVSTVEASKIGENGFEFSDHQPVTVTFKLI